MSLRQVFYVSRSLATPQGIEEILAVSRARNAQAGLTGALLCTGGFFAQVLEGPVAAVDRTMAAIDADARHCGLTRLLEEHSDARRFAKWSMAFTELDGADDLVSHLMQPAQVDGDRARRLIDLMFGSVAAPRTSAYPSSNGALNS